ncbi:MAG: hypothetical protein Fur0035_16710 [Anaerolineales bacterium]
MSAPILWIALPLALAALLLFVSDERWCGGLGGAAALILAALALFFPTDSAQRVFGLFSVRIDSTLTLLGRQIQLTPADQLMLVLAYGIGAFWFFGALAVRAARKIVPFGLAILALLVASLAVTPFLYAALLIEIAALLVVPMLATPGRGLLRFITYQTLAMPFILLAGFLLTGVEAGPRDFALVAQAAVILGIGFAFLLSVFPLHSWIPMLAQEAPLYRVAFLFMVFPTFHLLFALNFVDRYAWLRESPAFFAAMRLVGLISLVYAGIFAMLQRHQGRMLGYFVLAESGLSLVALSLSNHVTGLQLIFGLIVPRSLALALWALALAVLQPAAESLSLRDLQGAARRFPLAAAGIIFAMLSLSGVPLLAGFPLRQSLWETLAAESPLAALWLGLGGFGLWVASLRTLAALLMAPEGLPWQSGESAFQRALLALGALALFVIGIFPQWVNPLLVNLPGMFERFGK